MRIYIDVDGVLANFVAGYLSLTEHVTGRHHTPEQVTTWEFRDCIVSEDEEDKIWRLIDTSPGFVRGLEEMPGARIALARMRLLGSVRALTSPHFGPTWMPERAEWLLERGFRKGEILFVRDKWLVPGDALIDDKLENVNKWAAAHPLRLPILVDRPYNRSGKMHPAVVRTTRWSEVFAALENHL
jgi:5'(3')-deoxyribonucleotidase